MVDKNGPSGQTPACQVVGMALVVIFTGTTTITVPMPVKVHGRAYATDHESMIMSTVSKFWIC